MNNQMLIKKVALSALLVSAVAVPTAVNAASGDNDVNTKATIITGNTLSIKGVPATKVTTAAKATSTATLTAIDWADPLELSKKYAPDTEEDWKNTLDKYYKAAGFSVTAVAELVPSEQAEGVSFTKVISSGEAASVQLGDAIPGDITVEGEVFTLSNAVGASAISISEPSEADKAFFKAHDDLNTAAKSQDAAVIKEALSKLLNQYKEQIKVLEAAK